MHRITTMHSLHSHRQRASSPDTTSRRLGSDTTLLEQGMPRRVGVGGEYLRQNVAPIDAVAPVSQFQAWVQKKQDTKVEDWTKVLKMGEYARQINAEASTRQHHQERQLKECA
eukprot:8128974-Pyramimonas_sp.AAC.3